MRIAVVDTGATSISRRKPNSRSHTIEMPAKAAVNSTDIDSTPGNRNVLKSTPPVPAACDQRAQAAAEHEQEQQRLGQRATATRVAVAPKRIISRCHTTSAARTSWPSPPWGTRPHPGAIGSAWLEVVIYRPLHARRHRVH